jgi:pimeloyl-ACP methyl ester carboxylesterase
MAGPTPDSGRELQEALAASFLGAETVPLHEGTTGQGLALNTHRGSIPAILHPGDPAGQAAVLWVGGARGGYAGPGEGIYTRLAGELTSGGITSLRLSYRRPGVYGDSVWDALMGVEFLKSRGCSRIALVGHSFGGAVVIAAATFSQQVAAVASLSPQTYGAHGAPYVSPRPLLIVHGLEDTRLSPRCAEQIHQWARDPKELVLYPGAEHGLRECKEELQELLRRWISEKLSREEGPAASLPFVQQQQRVQ